MKLRGRWGGLICGLLLGLSASAALADGGRVQLHENAGPFVVTLFTAPDPLKTGEADLSVLVEERKTGETLLDPAVEITLTPANSGEVIMARLTHAQATNRLLEAAKINFPQAGKWRLTMAVRNGGESAEVATTLDVAPGHPRAAIVWWGVLTPLAILVLFGVHQRLKWVQRQERQRDAIPR